MQALISQPTIFPTLVRVTSDACRESPILVPRKGRRGRQTHGVVGSDFAKQMVTQTPLGRFGQPDDIAKIAVFLTSNQLLWELAAAGGFR